MIRIGTYAILQVVAKGIFVISSLFCIVVFNQKGLFGDNLVLVIRYLLE